MNVLLVTPPQALDFRVRGGQLPSQILDVRSHPSVPTKGPVILAAGSPTILTQRRFTTPPIIRGGHMAKGMPTESVAYGFDGMRQP